MDEVTRPATAGIGTGRTNDRNGHQTRRCRVIQLDLIRPWGRTPLPRGHGESLKADSFWGWRFPKKSGEVRQVSVVCEPRP